MNAREAIAKFIGAADDATLRCLLALNSLLGTRRKRLPAWAAAAIERREPVSLEVATEFRTLMARAWANASRRERDELRVIALRLGVPVPVDVEQAARDKAPFSAPMRRTRYADSAPVEIAALRAAQRSSSDSEPVVSSRLEARDWSSDEGSAWEPCASLSDALHSDNRGWW